MSRSQSFPNREPRKLKRKKGKKAMPNYMLDARGRVVDRDDSTVELWLAVHHESQSGLAWLVSTDGNTASGVWVPKSMITIGDAGGALQAWHRARMVSVVVHYCAMPAFIAMEKGLIPKQGARAA